MRQHDSYTHSYNLRLATCHIPWCDLVQTTKNIYSTLPDEALALRQGRG